MAHYWAAAKRPFSNWKVFWLGTLISLIPILNLALYGFALEIARHPKHLPLWKPFKKRWKEGLFAFCVLILLLAPALIIGTYIQIMNSEQVWLAWLFLLFLLLGVYVYPASLLAVASSGWNHAISKKTFDIAFTMKYCVAWLMANLISIIVGIVVGLPGALLSFTIIVPFVLWAGSVPFTIAVVTMTIMGEAK